jgi:hypothetical protein
MEHPQFAYTGRSPEKGYVGFVNLQEVEGGVRFSIRSEGEHPVSATHIIPKDEAIALLSRALDGLGGPLKHDYWRAGEPNCPKEIKAGNGELHTLRCKRCGLDDPRNDICLAVPGQGEDAGRAVPAHGSGP